LKENLKHSNQDSEWPALVVSQAYKLKKLIEENMSENLGKNEGFVKKLAFWIRESKFWWDLSVLIGKIAFGDERFELVLEVIRKYELERFYETKPI